MKYKPKIGETVRVIISVSGGLTGLVGRVESINNADEIWVTDPLNGGGGLCTEVVPHKAINFDRMRTILLEYKAGEINLGNSMMKLDEFLYEARL